MQSIDQIAIKTTNFKHPINNNDNIPTRQSYDSSKARVYFPCNMFLMVASILNAEEYNSTNYQKKFKEQTDFH